MTYLVSVLRAEQHLLRYLEDAIPKKRKRSKGEKTQTTQQQKTKPKTNHREQPNTTNYMLCR